jgi:glucose-1-phosphate thymidylyltransferase
MCFYYFPEEKVKLVKEYMFERKGQNDAIGLYIDWLKSKESVYGFVFGGKWYDIGHHKTFTEARRKFLQ